jgi:hypothetical protein
LTLRSPKDTETGAAKMRGSSAATTFARPPPASVTGAGTVRALSAHAVPAVFTSADLSCAGVHAGWRWSRRATAPATCGVAMLVPSKTANGESARAGFVEERTAPPGAAMSGLRPCVKSVGPTDEKLVTTPPRPVTCSRKSWPASIGARPPLPARCSAIRAPSKSLTISDGISSTVGTGLASPARLST